MICLDLTPTNDLDFLKVGPILAKTKILTHQIIQVYIMMQYSHCAIIFLFVSILKIIFAVLLSSVAYINSPAYTNNTNANNTIDIDMARNCFRDDLFWNVYLLTIGTTLCQTWSQTNKQFSNFLFNSDDVNSELCSQDGPF